MSILTGHYPESKFPAATRFISAVVLVLALSFVSACTESFKVKVEMVEKNLVFVLDEPRVVGFLRVVEPVDRGKTGVGKWDPDNTRTLWLLGYDLTVPVESRKYIKLDKVVYGQKYEEFSRVEGPVPLRRNVEYRVEIDNGGSFAVEFFTIQDDGTIRPSKNAAGENESIY